MISLREVCHRPHGFVTFHAKITTPCRGVLRAAPIVSASENTTSMGSQRTVRSGFKEFENGFLVFALGHFPRNFLFGPKFAKIEGSPQMPNLYWDPYYNGFGEIRLQFWRFFESAGVQKCPQTIPILTNLKKYICNIK